MSIRLGQFVLNSIMSQSTSSVAMKKRFKTCLIPLFRKLILTASAPNEDSIPIEPCEDTREFFKQKNSSEAKSYLQYKLIVEKISQSISHQD